MIYVGIIGCGRIAQERHIPEYLERKDVEVYGFFDMNEERAQKLADQYKGKAYSSYEKMLEDEKIDAVSVCAANSAHAEITIKALQAGKHVLCEKPMAVTYAECRDMVDASKVSGKNLMIDQNQRLTAAHQKAKELIDAGEIGKVLTFRTTFGHGGPETWSIDQGKGTWFFDRKKAVMGTMADLGIHKTDLIQYLISQRVVETTAKLLTLDKEDIEGNKIGVDDNAICIYKMSEGAIGTMTASWTYYGEEDNSTIIYGTEGILRIYDDPGHSLVLVKKDGTKEMYDVDRIQTNDNQTKTGVIDLFVESIVKEEAPAISGESVLSAMRAVFASIESAEKGCSVMVED